MAKNTGIGFRKGVITQRTQTYNAKTKQYIKRDNNNRKIYSM